MNAGDVLVIGQDAIKTLLLVSAPLLIVGLLVGVGVALIQALTQIQEMTLVFVPKIVLMLIVFGMALPFMATTLDGFTARVLDKVAFSPT